MGIARHKCTDIPFKNSGRGPVQIDTFLSAINSEKIQTKISAKSKL